MYAPTKHCLFVCSFPQKSKATLLETLRKIPQMNNVKRFNVSLRGHEQMFLVQLLLRRLSNCQIIKWL